MQNAENMKTFTKKDRILVGFHWNDLLKILLLKIKKSALADVYIVRSNGKQDRIILKKTDPKKPEVLVLLADKEMIPLKNWAETYGIHGMVPIELSGEKARRLGNFFLSKKRKK